MTEAELKKWLEELEWNLAETGLFLNKILKVGLKGVQAAEAPQVKPPPTAAPPAERRAGPTPPLKSEARAGEEGEGRADAGDAEDRPPVHVKPKQLQDKSWGVRLPEGVPGRPGMKVVKVTRDGQQYRNTLGELVEKSKWGDVWTQG